MHSRSAKPYAADVSMDGDDDNRPPGLRQAPIITLQDHDSSEDLDDLWRIYQQESKSDSPINVENAAPPSLPPEVLKYGRPSRPERDFEPKMLKNISADSLGSHSSAGTSAYAGSPARRGMPPRESSFQASDLWQGISVKDKLRQQKRLQRESHSGVDGTKSGMFRNKKVNPFMVVMYVNRILQLARLYKKPVVEEALTSLDLLRMGVIHPASKFKQYWDLGIIAIVLYNVVLIPFRIAFDSEASGAMSYIEYTFDVTFGIDLLLNFRTAYFKRAELIFEAKSIAKHYLKTWFIVDFVSTFPFHVIIILILESQNGSEVGNESVLTLPRLVRVLRLIKLMRLIKLFKVTKTFRALVSRMSFNTSLFKLVKLGVMLLGLAHWFGCIWYFVADLQPQGVKTWHIRAGLVDEETQAPLKPVDQRYIASFYWAVATITTVGYGDIVPQNPPEQIMAVLCLLIGVTAFSYAVGTMSSIVQQLDQQSIEFNNKLSVLNRYVDRYQLPKELAFKMRDHYRYCFNSEGSVLKNEEMEIFSILPHYLQAELSAKLIQNKLGGFELLKGYPAYVVMEFIGRLQPLHVEGGQTLFEKGDKGRHLYLIVRGQLRVVAGDDDIYAVLHPGTCVGEVALLVDDDHERMAAVEAVVDSELLAMRVEDFDGVLNLFPPMRDRFLALARTRVIKSSMRENLKRKLARRKTIAQVDVPDGLVGDRDRVEAFHEPQDNMYLTKSFGRMNSVDRSSSSASGIELTQRSATSTGVLLADMSGVDVRLPGSTGRDKGWNEDRDYNL